MVVSALLDFEVSERDAVYLEIGTRSGGKDVCEYPDIDLRIDSSKGWYEHKDGTLYPRPGG